MARGWAERETFVARGASRSTQLPNSPGVQESRAKSGSYLLLRNDTISTQTGEDQRSGQEKGGRPQGGGVGIKVGH